MLQKVIKIFDKIQNVISAIAGICLILMLCVVFLQTFTRFVIFYSLPWSEELSRYLFMTMILIGINVGIKENLMVRIDIIDNYVKGNVKKFLELFRHGVALFVSSIFFYSTFNLVRIGQYQVSPAMQLPMHLIYSILLVGFFLSTISVLIKIFEECSN